MVAQSTQNLSDGEEMSSEEASEDSEGSSQYADLTNAFMATAINEESSAPMEYESARLHPREINTPNPNGERSF